MGIPVYFKTLIEDYNDLCLPHTRKLTIDNLYFDLNFTNLLTFPIICLVEMPLKN